MDLLQELDDYIKETINDALGLPVSTRTLQLKLSAYEAAYLRLRDQHLLLLDKFRQKEILIGRAKAEASMNAAALKKFVEENQRLAAECANLVSQCNKLERECSLYDNDREALMEFGNEADERAREADERAKDAEMKVHQLEEELGKALEDLQFYKYEYHKRGVDSSAESTDMEKNSLESILATLVGKDEVQSGHAFLQADGGSESCQILLKMWNSLRPSTRKVLSLAAKAKTLQQDKEHLRINLTRAEEEVKLLFEENNILDEENKKLLRQEHREQSIEGSGGKHTSSASAKRTKRKSSPRNSPVESKIDLKDIDSLRQPLSPLRHNSPDCRMHKK